MRNFSLQCRAVAGRIGGIGRLNRQFANPLQVVRYGGHGAVGGLRQGDGVVGVARGLVEASDLRCEAVGDGEAGSVILGAVDAHAGRKALHGGTGRALRTVQVALGIERSQIGVDDLGHFDSPSNGLNSKVW